MRSMVLEADDLSIGYGSRIVAEDISFTVHQGDYLAIVGENGAGKTTLMRTILGLQKPIRGSLSFGKEFSSEKIGWLPQQKETQKDFPASVHEVILSGCRTDSRRIFYQKAERERAEKAMEALGISDLCNCSYRKLSGGQKQRVLLARALCSSDGLMMLDEPVTGLDPETSRLMYSLIHQINQDGQTILMITHDLSAGLKDATHVLHMGERCTFCVCGKGRAHAVD